LPLEPDVSAALDRLCHEYEPRFEAGGSHVDLGATSTKFVAEVMWNWGKTAMGPALWTSRSFGRRRLVVLGRVERFRTVEEAEAELRADLDDWLRRQPWAKESRFPRLSRFLSRLP
jgi:hypothetical protein